jgi:hypothetical protein
MTDADRAPEREPVRFHLWQLLYVTALIAAGLANFGWWGLAWAGGTLAIWAIVFFSQSRTCTLMWLACLVLVGTCCSGILVPGVGSRPASPGFHCHVNRRQICRALEGYRLRNGGLPPASIADVSGKVMHSWRVLILPYLGHEDLFNAYHFDEPWDGPNNSKLLPLMPDVYRCPTWLSTLARRSLGWSPAT